MFVKIPKLSQEERTRLLKLGNEGGKKLMELDSDRLSSVTLFGGWLKGGVFDTDTYTGCHSSLASNKFEGCELLVNGLSYQHEGWAHATDEHRLLLLDYLLNDSPWAGCYLEDDASEVLDKKFLCVRTDIDKRLVSGACTITRVMWEQSNVPRAFFDLVTGWPEINRSYALLLAHIIPNGDYIISLVSSEGHSCLHPSYMSKQTIFNFVFNQPEDYKPSQTFRVEPGYQGHSYLWGGKAYGVVDRDIPVAAIKNRAATNVTTKHKPTLVGKNNPFTGEANKWPRGLFVKAIVKEAMKVIE
jgi:hypothetical protein